MDELKISIDKIAAEAPNRIIVSKQLDKTYEYKKAEILRNKSGYQITRYTEKQAFHKNISKEELAENLYSLVNGYFGQINAWSDEKELAVMISKKGKVTLTTKINKISAKKIEITHNRQKNYLIPEGNVIMPLVDMGIFTHEGKIVRTMYDKYRQINRFLEFIDDCIKDEKLTSLNIIDFGCGKSYLTFIVYYYLTEIRKIDAHMIGLDLKADVIKKCNEAAERYGYTNLRFELGDINGFKAPFDVDMVLTLHACDTATDYALYNAVKWNAGIILSVPCCQHELNAQIHTDNLAGLTRYGIVKERVSALMTDAIRGNMLEYSGYKTQLLEFVDMEHTPKNILIRAMKANISNEKRERALTEVQKLMKEFNLDPAIYRLIKE